MVVAFLSNCIVVADMYVGFFSSTFSRGHAMSGQDKAASLLQGIGKESISLGLSLFGLGTRPCVFSIRSLQRGVF